MQSHPAKPKCPAFSFPQNQQFIENEKILDHMGSEELGTNLFRITQAEAKMRRDDPQGLDEASAIHYTVGKEVRETIENIGGTMPEDLPIPKKSISQVEKE